MPALWNGDEAPVKVIEKWLFLIHAAGQNGLAKHAKGEAHFNLNLLYTMFFAIFIHILRNLIYLFF